LIRKIQILGTGCPKCKKMLELTEEAVKGLGVVVEIEKVEDINKIMSYGVMLTPALVVDGVVKISGKLPSMEEIRKVLTNE